MDDPCSKMTCDQSGAAGYTGVHVGVSVMRVVGVWRGIGWRIVANHKVDCSLEESNSLLQHLTPKWKSGSLKRDRLTPTFCPFSFSKGTFLDGSDLT